MTVMVQASISPTVDGVAIENGDEIGAFTAARLCVGSIVWSGSNAAITIWGDNDQTATIDGMVAGDTLKYRVWDASLAMEIPAAVTYTSGGTIYSVDGMAILSSLAASTYSVTYNGNGSTDGTTPNDANKYPQGATVTVLGNTGSLVKTGSTFAGWNTAVNGSGTSYAGSETFVMGTANVTLYAQWTVNPTYTVTYKGNGNTGGSVPADTNSYEKGATVSVSGNTGSLVKTGSTFAGWNTAANGSGTSYAGSETFVMGTANVTLYAQWKNTYTLSIVYVIGSGLPVKDRDSVVNHGDTIRVTAPTRSSSGFIKWKITTGSAVLLDSTSLSAKVVLTSGDVTLTAVYDPATEILNQAHSLPSAFDFSFNTASFSIQIAVPRVTGYSSVTVCVRLYDLSGRILCERINTELSAGYYNLKLSSGNNGIMWGICRMDAAGFSKTEKVLLKR
ncbi:MAG: InlB B-repeat-containing protein [Fibrobacter sp.]|nr:InlB B-repeat-containing protein [Fibrobacter sp.]